jgi:hypothetical protein
MNVCKRHEETVIVYSSSSCPLCDVGGILEAADQKMRSAIGMVNTVRRALEKDREEYFLSTLEVAGDFIGTARERVIRAMEISSGNLEPEVSRLLREAKKSTRYPKPLG